MQSGPSRAHPADGAPFLGTLGATVTVSGSSGARLELPYRDSNSNRNGTLHGGVVAAILSVVGSAAADAGFAASRTAGASTIDFTVHYLAPAIREPVTAEAVVLRRGRDITFVDVAVQSSRGVIARGLIARRAGGASGGGTAARRDDADRPQGQVTAVADDTFVSRNTASPFTRQLGVASARLGRGHSIALLPLADAILAEDGTVHEGAITALVDCAGGAAAWSIDGFDPAFRAATIGMHLCFDVGTSGEDVAAEARTSWNSDGIYVSSVLVAGRTSGRAVASGSVTYRIAARGKRS